MYKSHRLEERRVNTIVVYVTATVESLYHISRSSSLTLLEHIYYIFTWSRFAPLGRLDQSNSREHRFSLLCTNIWSSGGKRGEEEGRESRSSLRSEAFRFRVAYLAALFLPESQGGEVYGYITRTQRANKVRAISLKLT